MAVAFSTGEFANDASLSLTVEVDGVSSVEGLVTASLCASKADYLKKPVSEKTEPVSTAGATRLVFKGLNAGIYTVSVIHDADGDDELDTGA